MIFWRRFQHDSVPGTICPPHQLPTSRVQKPGETALDTLFFLGSQSIHVKSARDTGEFLKSVAHFLQMLYKCYTFVIYNI